MMTTEYSRRQVSPLVNDKKENLPQILLVLLAFCEKNFVRYVLLALSMVPVVGFFSDFLLFMAYLILIFMCMNKKVSFGSEWFILIFTAIAIIFSCIIYQENAPFLLKEDVFWNTIFPCLRWFIVAIIIIPDEHIMDLLGKASCGAIVIETIFLLAYMMPNDLLNTDDMNRSYQLLPNVLLTFNYAFNNKKPWPWFFAIVGLIYTLSLGARGPFVIILAFIILKFLRTSMRTKGQKFLGALGIAGVGSALSVPEVNSALLGGLSNLFSSLGLSTRILDHIFEGTMISYTSGRDELVELAWEKLAERPFLGYGVYGEWPWLEWNVHNIYLELWIHFGVVLGSILILWGLNLIWRAYRKTDSEPTRDMILIFACFVLVRGFYGGSYLTYGCFFLLGLCAKEKQRIKQREMAQKKTRYHR